MSNPTVDPDDLALFALQLLPPDEMTIIKGQLHRDEATRALLAEVQGDLALLALSVATDAPSAGSRERLLDQLSREPQQAPPKFTAASTATTLPRSSNRVFPVLAQPGHTETPRSGAALRVASWLGWAAAAALTVTTGLLIHQRRVLREEVADANHRLVAFDQQTARARRLLETLQDPSAKHVTLTLTRQHPVPQGKATYDADRGALVFVANNLEPLQTQKAYELWVIPADGTAPIPAGTFKPDHQGSASLLLPKLPVGVAAKAFGVTVENEGGATTPTMPILLAGSPG